jgi:hypothetical protein
MTDAVNIDKRAIHSSDSDVLAPDDLVFLKSNLSRSQVAGTHGRT